MPLSIKTILCHLFLFYSSCFLSVNSLRSNDARQRTLKYSLGLETFNIFDISFKCSKFCKIPDIMVRHGLRKQRKHQAQTCHSRSRPPEIENLHCNSGRQSLGPSAECLVSHQLVLVSPRTRRSTRTHKTKLRVLGGRERTRVRFDDP